MSELTLAPPNKRLNQLAIGLCILNFFVWFNILLFKYVNFGYYDWDLALFSQTMWNLSHGSMNVSLMGINFLGNHGNYFAFLLAPLYALAPHPTTLIFLKVLAVSGGGFIFYKIARDYIGSAVAILFLFLYFIFPANIFMLLFEFDFENIAVFFIFLLIYFFLKNNLKGFLITALFTCLLKENMPLVVTMFGVYGFFSKKNQRLLWGFIPIVIGMTIFYVGTSIITPYIRRNLHSGGAMYTGLYNSYGNTWFEIFLNMLIQYKKTFLTILSPINIKYLINLLGPLIFIVLFSPASLIPAFPLFLQSLLSNATTTHTIYFHYSATILPFIFIAAVRGLNLISEYVRPAIFKLTLTLLVVLCIMNTGSFKDQYLSRIKGWVDPLDDARWILVKSIPQDAGVVATFRFLPELSNRRDLYSLHHVWRNGNQITGESPYVIPSSVHYALIDFTDDWLIVETRHDVAAQKRLEAFLNQGWKVKKAFGKVVLFEKI